MSIKEIAIAILIVAIFILFIYGCFKLLIWSHRRGVRIATKKLQKQIDSDKINNALLQKRYISARKSRDTFNKIENSLALKIVIFIFFGIFLALFIRRDHSYYEALEAEMLHRGLLSIAETA